MLRSILFQVLNDFIPVVFPLESLDEVSLQNTESNPRTPKNILVWHNLTNALDIVLTNLKDTNVFIFLDGSDEYRMAGRKHEYTEEQLDLIYDGNNEDEAWGRST
ncbi:putative related to small s protein [Rosellinia necatrix]|uniref:Putative related to small s protein n=1 Tax=Rosellinia necatrix TaxID=77044 RepID=A0A1S8AAE2_ROSNE|nr:putative related to small s protein [Rosellinia necatrix]